ncbi:MAG: hypothetical protein ACRCX4_11745 [Bacteroidales bacterium]
MGYLKIARELFNSSFWRSLAPAEQAILINLMTMAAYKPTTYNLYGTEIELNKYEFCFSVIKMAEKYHVTEYAMRSLIKKLEDVQILTKTTRKITRQVSSEFSRGKSRCEYVKKATCCYTSVTFCGWVFYDDDECDNKGDMNDEFHEALQAEVQTVNREHNKEILKKEVLKKETRRNSACAVPVSNGSKGKEYRKPWYTMEQIAKMDLPYADEIMKEWTEYSGRSKKDVSDILQKFTHKQRLFGLPEMTLDVFNKEFRKEMKSAFALKSKQKNEPQRYLYYYGEDD